ncbi:hypothetical protein GCM10010359_08500 [Streptomyces morookaense]|uniref:non-specific serine/threonine protein kinase n=1 Tax=Streptomyces morookaense TaxID=1970 RepID=A0A7Y7BAV1_STRMO|nr:protein kinase [Streptomyces morookaense]GHF09396.1 hypothetical protein GCM10010359_08500 [Streptomyces morookaense]
MSEAEQTQGTTGRLLAGRYRLGKVLGRGGMGTVWRATDETLGRTVAVKELRFPANIDEDEKRRLITRTLREAKAIARIRSAGAVTVYDVVHEDDRPWIVMELIEGRSLAEVIREDGPLKWRRAAEVGLAVLDVLRAAHREGILHRDVKPSNVLIADDGRVVLTDFGIAQVEGDPSVTSTGMLVGAPSYISPERARGQKPGPPADLWSLGGLLYAATEGAPPYDKGSAIATLTAVMTEPLGPPKNAGPLAEVMYGLLAKDPQKRLDEAGARALLTDAVNAPDERLPKRPEPQPDLEATQAIAVPAIPALPSSSAERTKQTKQARQAERSQQSGRTPAAAKPSTSTSRPSVSSASSSASPSAGSKPKTMSAGSSRPSSSDAPTDRIQSSFRPLRDAVPSASASASEPERTALQGLGSVSTGIRIRGSARSGSFGRASLTDVVPRKVLLVAVVVVALAVLGTVLALAFSDGGKDQDGKGGSTVKHKSASTIVSGTTGKSS